LGAGQLKGASTGHDLNEPSFGDSCIELLGPKMIWLDKRSRSENDFMMLLVRRSDELDQQHAKWQLTSTDGTVI
jgi:hypothetical protein